ncbi:MAG: hypothetical protein ACP5Q1_11165, partial [Anaerolineae bacterium]
MTLREAKGRVFLSVCSVFSVVRREEGGGVIELRALFRYVRPYWKQMTLAGLALVAGSLISLALPWALRALVDSVFVSREQEQLNRLILSLLALFLLQSV